MDINPCPYCQQIPVIKTRGTIIGPPEHYLECSNLIDCHGWPYTEPFPTEAQAIAEWNEITMACAVS